MRARFRSFTHAHSSHFLQGFLLIRDLHQFRALLRSHCCRHISVSTSSTTSSVAGSSVRI